MARRTLLLIAALVVAAMGTALIVTYVSGIQERANAGQEMVEVLTATERIESGETVAAAQSAGKIDSVQISRSALVDGALSSTSSLTGQVALGDIFPGEQLLRQKFGAAGDESGLTIPDDKLAISVELTDPERVAGFVTPGSDVAVFVSSDLEAIKADGSTQKLPPQTRLLLPKVQVIGVGTTTVTARTTTDESGTETTEEIPRTILTVAVDEEQAEKVIFGSRNGDLSFALLSEKSKVSGEGGISTVDIFPEVAGGLS